MFPRPIFFLLRLLLLLLLLLWTARRIFLVLLNQWFRSFGLVVHVHQVGICFDPCLFLFIRCKCWSLIVCLQITAMSKVNLYGWAESKQQSCSFQIFSKGGTYFIFAFCALSDGVSVQTLVSPRPSFTLLLNLVDCIDTPPAWQPKQAGWNDLKERLCCLTLLRGEFRFFWALPSLEECINNTDGD